MPWLGIGCSPADLTWRAGVDALSFGFVKNGGISAEALIFFGDRASPRRPCTGASAPAICCPRAAIWPRRSWRCSRTELWLRNARAANDAAARLAEAAGRTGWSSGRGQRDVPQGHARRGAALRAQGFDFYDWGPGEARLVTSWDSDPAHATRSPRRSGRCERRRRAGEAGTSQRRSRAELRRRRTEPAAPTAPQHAPAADPPPLPPDHPDLGLDLDRHQGPARRGAAGLVGHLSLRHRRRGDVRLGGGERGDACASAAAAMSSPLVRDPAILPQLQFRLRGRASHHLAAWSRSCSRC